MLKKRIIPKFLIKAKRLVKGVKFHQDFREAGNPVATAKIYNSYGVDELMLLDIESASISKSINLIKILERVSTEIFMPLTVGGGIRTLKDINQLLRAGADKISLCTSAIEKPELVKQATKTFGSQCISICIDYKEVSPQKFLVFTRNGKLKTNINPIELALKMQELDCGEIILSSIDRDGTLEGYDIEMLLNIKNKVDVPIIISGGAGNLRHCETAFKSGADAVTVSSMFFFTDNSPIKLRSYLFSRGINVRASKNSRN